ncbi:hypothetical protein KGM_202009 [Danaus plexippus plexippus]|uniref:Uncharacterized protein n=1 Tax=Danaus plexippus plexippus TaxID=278856 RepID=A0A212EGN8_DANPL|nr:hypothetical protein KGM_202009 [Danaus plexippus plexippus]
MDNIYGMAIENDGFNISTALEIASSDCSEQHGLKRSLPDAGSGCDVCWNTMVRRETTVKNTMPTQLYRYLASFNLICMFSY